MARRSTGEESAATPFRLSIRAQSTTARGGAELWTSAQARATSAGSAKSARMNLSDGRSGPGRLRPIQISASRRPIRVGAAEEITLHARIGGDTSAAPLVQQSRVAPDPERYYPHHRRLRWSAAPPGLSFGNAG